MQKVSDFIYRSVESGCEDCADDRKSEAKIVPLGTLKSEQPTPRFPLRLIVSDRTCILSSEICPRSSFTPYHRIRKTEMVMQISFRRF